MSEVKVITAERGKRGLSDDGEWQEYAFGEALLSITPGITIGGHLVDRVKVDLMDGREVSWKAEFTLKGWPLKPNGEVDARAIRHNVSELWLPAVGCMFADLFSDGLMVFGEQWLTREDVMARINHLGKDL